MLRSFRDLLRDDRGIAATEMALLAPPLIMVFVGVIELSFKLWSTQKAEKLAVTVSDVVAQAQTVTVDGLEEILAATDDIMQPFYFGESNGQIIISSVYRGQGEEDAKVNWQCIKNATYGKESKVGAEDDEATLPEDLTLNEKENVIVAEVFYTYKPVLPGLIFDGSEVAYRAAYFKPRLGALTNSPGESCTF
jgi:Flp pilus assembly pilin Flp